MARARLFKELIKDLGNESTANYALLALWQLYKDENDRRIILAAALQNPDQKTLQMLLTLGLQKELEPYIKQIEAMLKNGGKASTTARELLIELEPKRYLRFLLDDLQSGENADLVDERIQEIRLILESRPALEKVISKNLDKKKSNYTTIALALYLTGAKSALKEQIREIEKNPKSNFNRMAFLVGGSKVHLDKRDWVSLATAAANVINASAAGAVGKIEVAAIEAAVFLLKQFDFQSQFLASDIRVKLTGSLETLFLHPKLDAITRADIAILLFELDMKKALVVFAMAKTCDKIERLVDIFLADSLKKIRTERPDYPAKGSSGDEWRTWFNKNANGRTVTC